MSRRHAWLTFTGTGPPLPRRPDADPRAWQDHLRALQGRWYAVDAPQVAAAFVLQWVLQVPAHAAAYAATTGQWRADLASLSYSLGPALVPDRVRITTFESDAGDLVARLDRARRDYRAIAEPLATAYPAVVRLGPHTRDAMVDDMWQAAEREALGAAGVVRTGVVARESCCLIYALPGCGECAGCPRARAATRTRGRGDGRE